VVGYVVCYGEGTNNINWSPRIYSTNTPCNTTIISDGSNWIRTYTVDIDVGNSLQCEITNLVAGKTYYFTVVSYDLYGLRSDYSDEVKYTVSATKTNSVPSQPQNFQFWDGK